MILNYAEASAYATAIAQYLILACMGTMILTWAWENLVTYFHWFNSPATDLDDVVDAIAELQSALESAIENEHTLEIIA